MLFVRSDYLSGVTRMDQEDVVLLRDILVRELDTINFYKGLPSRARRPDVAAFIAHITDEEKEHVAEAMNFINKLDAAQAARFTASDHWRDTTGGSGEYDKDSADPARQPEPPGRLTVGSLRTRTDV
jgi:hypothetical protein